jgi:hypothetical protein
MKTRSVNWLALMAVCVSIYAIVLATGWPRRMSLFPLTIGVALFAFSAVEFILSLLTDERDVDRVRVDFELSAGLEEGARSRQTITVFAWIIGFFVMIVLFGFLVSVPVFVLLCMRILGGEPWWSSVAVAFSSWAFVYIVFDRLLHIPFPQPWIAPLF